MKSTHRHNEVLISSLNISRLDGLSVAISPKGRLKDGPMLKEQPETVQKKDILKILYIYQDI